MLRLAIFLTLLFSLIHCFSRWTYAEDGPDPAPAFSLQLLLGQTYPLDGMSSAVFKPDLAKIVEIHQDKGVWTLKPLRAGQTLIEAEIDGKPVRIKVEVSGVAEKPLAKEDSDQSSFLSPLRKAPGLKLLPIAGNSPSKFVAQGEILTRAVYQKLLRAQRLARGQLLILAKLAPGVRESLLEQGRTRLVELGLQSLSIRALGHRYFLEGSVSSPEDLEGALEAVDAILPGIENRVAIPIRVDPTITVRVFLLELSRHAHEVLGLNWSGRTSAAVLSPKETLFDPIWQVTLKHLSSHGEAKVLAEPFLAVKVGGQASLSAGGEIPIRITGQFDNRVVWKNYGVKIDLSVSNLAGKFVRTKITTESSQLDDATAVDGVPGMKSNRMSTEVDAVMEQPIFLTGIFQAEQAKDVEKVPLLGSIPILGELFKSRRFRNRETELLIAFVPSFGSRAASMPPRGRVQVETGWKFSD